MFLSLLHVNTVNSPGRQWLSSLYRIHQRLWMAFPDQQRVIDDAFFLGTWDGPPPNPQPARDRGGFLFRVERDRAARILVQSVQRPDWDYAFGNAGHLLDGHVRIREFEPMPEIVRAYRFRLLANVVRGKSVPREDGKTRITASGLTIAKRRRTELPVRLGDLSHPLPLDTDQRNDILQARWEPWRKWLAEMGRRHGFLLNAAEPSLQMQTVHAVVHSPSNASGGSDDRPAIKKRYNAGLFDGVLTCTDVDKLRTAIINGVGHSKAFGFGLLSLAPVK